MKMISVDEGRQREREVIFAPRAMFGRAPDRVSVPFGASVSAGQPVYFDAVAGEALPASAASLAAASACGLVWEELVTPPGGYHEAVGAEPDGVTYLLSLLPADGTLEVASLDGVALAAGTDYTLSGQSVTVAASLVLVMDTLSADPADGVTYTLSHPFHALSATLDGAPLTYGTDYTVSGQSLTVAASRVTLTGEVLAGDGTAYTLPHEYVGGSLAIYQDGAPLAAVTDYTLSGLSLTLAAPVDPASVVITVDLVRADAELQAGYIRTDAVLTAYYVTAPEPVTLQFVQTDGDVTLADWSAVTGLPSLDPGSTYYLAGAPGGLSLSPPSGGAAVFCAPVGEAIDTQTFRINLNHPVTRGV